MAKDTKNTPSSISIKEKQDNIGVDELRKNFFLFCTPSGEDTLKGYLNNISFRGKIIEAMQREYNDISILVEGSREEACIDIFMDFSPRYRNMGCPKQFLELEGLEKYKDYLLTNINYKK